MGDIKSRNLILAKGFLFLLLGFIAAVILLMEVPTIKVATLFAISLWAFCRFYYFAFYVIQHYVDSEYRFDGLYSFLRYLLRSKIEPRLDASELNRSKRFPEDHV